MRWNVLSAFVALTFATAVGAGCARRGLARDISVVGTWYPSYGSTDQGDTKPDPANGVLVFNENHTFVLRQREVLEGRWQQSGLNITLEGYGDNYFVQARTGQGAGAPNMNLFLGDDGKSMFDPANENIRFVRG